MTYNSRHHEAEGNDLHQAMKRFLGPVAAVLIGLTAAWPLLGGMLDSAVPEGGDTLLHLYRAVQLNALFQEGILYSRWAPDLAYGYGYPLFNYYAPLSYYLVQLFHLLGLGLVGAFLAAFVAAFAGAALFTYTWVRSIFGEAAGLVSAALYAFSPYLLIDGFQRGALAELVALALLPLILWTFRLVLLERRWFYGLIAVLAYTALILTHNISALIFTPVLLAYSWVVGIGHSPAGRSRWLVGLRLALPALGLMILGLGLSAFYWLPALAEQDLVRISQAFGPSHFNYAANFLAVGDLLAAPFVVDPRLVHQETPLAISLIAALLALLGLAGLGRYRVDGDKGGHIVLATLVVVISLFMVLPVSVFIWDSLPLLPFVQFPWRFLGLASLFLAMLAGVGVDWLLSREGWSQKKLRLALPGLVVGLAAVYMLPWQYSDTLDPPPAATLAGAAAFARQSGTVGTTSTGEYLPVAVAEVPAADRPGFPDDQARLVPESLPSGARLFAAAYQPLAYDLALDSPEPFTALFNTFFFEGWQGTIDGRPVAIRATGPSGLISLEVPAGQHDLAIRFASTTTRDLAVAISWASLALLVVSLVLLARSGGRKVEAPPQTAPIVAEIVIAVLLVVLLLGTIFRELPFNPLHQSRFDGAQVAGVDHSLRADFDGKLLLLGADLPAAVAGDGTLNVDLYWQAPQPADKEYSTSVAIVDGQGLVVGQSDKQHPGVIPTTRWEIDEYARDRHSLQLVPGTPPGDYRVQVRVYEYGRPEGRLSVLDQNGAPAGQELTIAALAVTRPEKPLDVETTVNGQRRDWPVGQGLVLAGYTLPEEPVRAGNPLFLELYWLATDEIGTDETMQVELVGEQGQIVLLDQSPLLAGLPTSSWQPGDLWRTTYLPRLAASTAGGTYEVMLSLGPERTLNLGTIAITAPEHQLTQPDMTFPAEIDFGAAGSSPVARLAGYDVAEMARPGETLPVSLAWLSLRETAGSYKVFVQLLDEEGRLVSGSDAIPANWVRPTTGWIAGEYIVDGHELYLPADLQPGVYRLLVGLYDEVSGERLLTAGGQDGYLLPQQIAIATQ